MLHNCVHSLYVYRSTSLSWLQRVAITQLTLKGCRRPARRVLVCTHTRQLYLRPTSHLLLRCLHQRHSRCNQLRRSTCNLEKEGGGACTGCVSAPSITYLQAQTLALTQPRLWKVSQGQQTRQALELSVEPQTPQVQKALEVGLLTQVQKVKEEPSPCFVLLVVVALPLSTQG